MQKIYINGRFFTQKITGEQRYAIEMINALDELLYKSSSNAFTWIILIPKNMELFQEIKKYKIIKIKKVGILKGHLWEQIELPFFSRSGMLLNFCDMAPILKKNQLVTIHDMAIMAHPEYYTRSFRYWHLFVYKCVVKRIKKICTVSNFSKSELEKYLKIDGNKIEVINCACATHLNNQKVYNRDFIEKNKIDLNKHVVLAVSSLSPNKNFKTIIESLKYIKDKDLELVIAGGVNSKEFITSDNEHLKKAKYVGYVSDEELITLYKIANCFVYPSFYEGFGLPPIEAMSYGCPAIVSNQTALPEVCGEAVEYCDPNDPVNLAKIIDKVLSNKNLQEKLKEKSLICVSKYSWEKSIREYFNLIMRILKNEE
ncbi:glycosyltransferase family 4 protein [Megamonas funiformis]|uniref:glycosyltransferase family 4 protein n=1 Tax=Megamonas funiformis TaxID=437897 RepID=UPI002674417E|nr:glycosyltransferase family 1 protein [Megamonas funiformis]